MKKVISLSQAVQVATGRALPGEKLGWATAEFCGAIAKLSGNSSVELAKGYSNGITWALPVAQRQIRGIFLDFANAVKRELDPKFDRPGSDNVDSMREWIRKNAGKKFPEHLVF